MKNSSVKTFDIKSFKNIKQIDSIADDFGIFCDIKNVPIQDYPTKSEDIFIVLCQQGSIEISVNLNHRTLCQREIGVLIPDNVIQIFNVSEDFKGRFIMMSKKFLDDSKFEMDTFFKMFIYLQECPIMKLTPKQFDCLLEYHDLLLQKMKIEDIQYKKQITHYLLYAIILEVTMYISHDSGIARSRKSRKEQLCEQFLQLVGINFRNERSIGFYAQKLFLTPKYLSAAIKEVTKRTAGEWIDEYVILEAKTLLKSSNLTIQQIAAELNFSDQSFFGKYFKSHTGQSPRQYKFADEERK